jgi:Mg-chelatase subunit ChlD
MSDEKSMSEVNAEIMAVVSPIADSCAIQISTNISKSSMARVLILTLDISGSMGGRPIEGGKAGIIQALMDAISSFDDIVVILYNHDIFKYDINKKNIEDVINRLKCVRADGYTDFIKLFAAITKEKNSFKNKHNNLVDITVSIFTDGEHTAGMYNDKSIYSCFMNTNKRNEVLNKKITELTNTNNPTLMISISDKDDNDDIIIVNFI